MDAPTMSYISELQFKLGSLQAELEEAEQEIDRLKCGNLTKEEFQNLCHNLSQDCTISSFRDGCLQYQCRLFGEDVLKETLAKELRYILRKVAYAYGIDGLADLLAKTIVDSIPY